MPQLTPAQVKCALALYDHLDTVAVKDEVEDGVWKVYTGSLLTAFNAVSNSRTYYKPVYEALEAVAAISITKRGFRSNPSQVVLHGRPTAASLKTPIRGHLTMRDDPAKVPLDKRVADIEANLQGIDIKALAQNFEQRLSELEKGGK